MDADSNSSLAGRRLGRYRITGKLGAGGMGEVWAAEDTSLKRQVALKLLPAELAADEQRLERFQREAETVAALNHPSIVTLYSVEEADGVRFLTMELVEGETLGEILGRGALPLERFFPVAVALADALAAAHAKGVVHRDLKPANVMITTEGRVKVLDFGLAKPLAEAARAAAPEMTALATEALTEEGVVLGTMPYMSPEQVQGHVVDHRSDIFSLGVVLYEMLCGRRPFGGDSPAALVSSILRDTPDPVTELRSDLPRQLARIVQQCLEKDPQRRYQSALDVRNQLESLATEVSSGTVVAATRPAPQAARRRGKASWIAAAAAVAVLAALAAWWSGRPGAPRRPAADAAGQGADGRRMLVVLPFENLGPAEDEYFAAGITDEITSRLASVSDLGVISRNSALRYAGTAKSAREIGRELGVTHVLAGTVRWARGAEGSRVRITPTLSRTADELQVWSQSFERVLEDIFEVQSDIAGRVIEQLGVTLLDREQRALDARPTDNLEAYQAYLRGLDQTGRLTYSLPDRLLEVEMFERAVELDPGFALAWAELSRAHSNLINLGMDPSGERLAAAKAAVDRALALAPELPEAHLALAYYHYWGKREYDQALAALAVAERGLPNSAAVAATRAWIARRQGRWQDSLRLAEESFRLDPLSSEVVREIGVILMSLRRFDRAVESLDRSIALAPDQQAAYLFKVMVEWARGDLAAARAAIAATPGSASLYSNWFDWFQALYERDWQAAEAAASRFPDSGVFGVPDLMMCRELALGDLERFRGNPSAARPLWQAARRKLEVAIAETPGDARAHAALGRVLAGLGLKQEAVAAGRHAVELLPVSRDALHGPRQQLALAMTYAWVGEPELAVEQLSELLSEQTPLTAAWIRLEPYFDPLRGHPGFEALMAAHR